MGREIYYTVTSKRPFTATELQQAEKIILAFNEMFKDGGRWANPLFNFEEWDGVVGGERFFRDGTGRGSTKPFGEVPALFLYGGLVALSKVLPLAEIEVDDHGLFYSEFSTVREGVVLRNGRLDTGESAARGVEPGHWVGEINELRPEAMKPVQRKSVRGGITSAQIGSLLSDIERVIHERIASGLVTTAPQAFA